MTTDPSPTETKKRRASAVDCGVFMLAVCSLAAPFAARLQVEAHASQPQVAVRGEVSPIRPIDIALGYEEEKAEAAFFEGLETPVPTDAEAALDVALATPTGTGAAAIRAQAEDVAAPDEPVAGELADAELPVTEKEPEIVFTDDLTIARFIEPKPARSVAVVAPPALSDFAIEPGMSDTPPSETPEPVAEAKPEAEPEDVAEVRVRMTVPPTMTPLPLARPKALQPEGLEVVSLETDRFVVPIDVTPPMDDAIEESRLAPLSVDGEADAPIPMPVTADAVEQVESTEPVEPVEIVEQPSIQVPAQLAMAEPPQIRDLPSDVTPDAPVAVVVAPAPEAPAQPVTKITNGPRIALVIAAAGLNENVTRFAIEALPEGVTLAFAPVKAEAGALAQEAKDDGHTVLVEIPMEPVNKNRDPGPLTLRVGDSAAQNLSRLDRALALVPVADGASSYLGARFNADEAAAAPVIASLASRGLFFFENEPTSRSVFQRLAARAELPYARGVVRIDQSRDVADIRAQLDRLEKQARRNGGAIGVGTALRGTISTVAQWAKEAEKRGVRLVAVTELER